MENENVVFVATATDIDISNDVLEVEWFSNIDGCWEVRWSTAREVQPFHILDSVQHLIPSP